MRSPSSSRSSRLKPVEGPGTITSAKRGTRRQHVGGWPVTSWLSENLVTSGTPRKLGEVAEALSKDGHTVPVTVLAVALLRLVRSKELQRVKEGGGWKYGNR